MISSYPEKLDIVMLGAGNVAHSLVPLLLEAGHRIIQVYGRSTGNAKSLSQVASSIYTTNSNEIVKDAHLYIFALPDATISELAQSFSEINGIAVHTSGSTPLSVLRHFSDNHGVFYPFQTFTKGRKVNLSGVPFCLEASNESVFKVMSSLAKSLGGTPIEMDSNTRQWLHISGVFSCNFVNHMLAIGQLIAQESDFDFDLLKPLIRETIDKALQNQPLNSQTGPAVRGDSDTIKKHVAMLSMLDDEIRDLYMSLSSSILNLKQLQ